MSRDHELDEQRIGVALCALERIADALERLEKRLPVSAIGDDGWRCEGVLIGQHGRDQCVLSDGHDGLCNFNVGP